MERIAFEVMQTLEDLGFNKITSIARHVFDTEIVRGEMLEYIDRISCFTEYVRTIDYKKHTAIGPLVS